MDSKIEIIVFSFDRASQVHACLSSFYDNFILKQEPKVTVLWKSSNEEYKKGYDKVKTIFSGKTNLFWEEEYNFQSQVKEVVSNIKSNFVMFLVDDDVFIGEVSLQSKQFEILSQNNSIAAVSLRLHSGVTHCYPTDKDTKVPKFVKKFVWSWKGKQGDWGYPMSVDGNVYNTNLIKEIVRNINFKNPNTFESNMDIISKQQGFPKYMCCFPKGGKIINIPANLVQTEYKNRYCDNISTIDLNNKFLNDIMINYKKYLGTVSNMVHVPLKLDFIQKEE